MDQQELEIAPAEKKTSALRLKLPWPPTANHYTGYRVAGPKNKPFVQAYPTARAKEFHRNVQAIVMRDRAAKGWSCPLRLSVWTYPPDRRKRDTSNLFKMLEDALERAGVFKDVYQITEHHAWRTGQIVKDGMVVVEIEPVVS